MFIHNVRLGHATNSSSSHSLIFLPGAARRLGDIPAHEPGSYGWEGFQLVSPEAKRDYLASVIYQRLVKNAGQDVAREIAAAWTGGRVYPDGYGSDHESRVDLPCDWQGRGVDAEFAKAFAGFVMRDDIVVCGGNDNQDVFPPATHVSDATRLALADYAPVEDRDTRVARYDAAHDYWTLFARGTGAKMRVRFAPGGEAPTRSTVPELVDVKITDYCPFDCKFCYQGSTRDGKHADYDVLATFAALCGRHRIFEVAIGGGEPTLHPMFRYVLSTFRDYGVVPNFTTKSLAWLRDKETLDAVVRHAGGFAYSADTAADVAALATALEAAKLENVDDDCYPSTQRPLVRARVQHVIGLDETPEAFEALLRTCADLKFPLTLLGFKTTGRGAAYGDHTDPGWLRILRDVVAERYLRVGIDTVLADRYYDALIAAGVPEWCLTRQDGRFSCYFDAVEGVLKPSSYEPEGGREVPMDFAGDGHGRTSLATDMSMTHFPAAYQSFSE